MWITVSWQSFLVSVWKTALNKCSAGEEEGGVQQVFHIFLLTKCNKKKNILDQQKRKKLLKNIQHKENQTLNLPLWSPSFIFLLVVQSNRWLRSYCEGHVRSVTKSGFYHMKNISKLFSLSNSEDEPLQWSLKGATGRRRSWGSTLVMRRCLVYAKMSHINNNWFKTASRPVLKHSGC